MSHGYLSKLSRDLLIDSNSYMQVNGCCLFKAQLCATENKIIVNMRKVGCLALLLVEESMQLKEPEASIFALSVAKH